MIKKSKIDIEIVKNYISNSSPSSKIYLGCDSSTFLKNGNRWADYVTVVVVHIDGNRGCKIFGQLETEKDFTKDKSKPFARLFNEAIKVVELYENIKDSIGNRYREIHLDINSNELYKSHLVLAQASGYVRGVCGIDPKFKPEAFASSAVADKFIRIKNFNTKE